MQKPDDMALSNQQFALDKPGLLCWEDGKNHLLQQDFADMPGWKELAQKTESYFQQQPDSVKAATIVYCRNYGLAGSMKYYANESSFRNKIISDNGTFLLWISEQLRFRHLLFVGYQMPGQDDEVFWHFRNVQVIDSCTSLYSRQYRNKIISFQDASDSAWILTNQGLNEMQLQFSR